MKQVDSINKKIMKVSDIGYRVNQWRVLGKTVSFTNGVFDLLHPGHIFSLSQAAREADYLVVGLNADSSVRRLKGDDRPINDQDARALLLASLIMVDAIVVFEDDTPLELIKAVMPDVIVKGGDYTVDQVVGAREVMANGGRVVINPVVEGFSTTSIIQQMKGSSNEAGT
jgi:D-beta-D-heptose 7-phosphate kinase/D-beta-D-heptose 1-phosphate adenosyltransferase